jgi:hypothetical protein
MKFKITKTEMAVGLAKSVVEWGVNGFPVSDTEEQKRRLEICRGCEHAVKGPMDTVRCALCGCVSQFKTWLETENCPEGRWGGGQRSEVGGQRSEENAL